jgi:predicted O-methyltransferase YrrM
MMFQVRSYFRFLWKSTNEHGVHSPFVFQLVTKCFYDKRKYAEYDTLKQFRESLWGNQHTITVEDFGAGSKVFRSNSRRISAIAKNAGISAKRAELLFRISKYFEPQNILEIGTSLGLATSALSSGNPSAKIISLEGCAATATAAEKAFSDFGLNNIDVVKGEFKNHLEQSLESTNYGLIYFDGNHTKEATLTYFDALLTTSTNNSVWIFDDIHWSSPMKEAWDIIKKHPKVTLTIDTFQWGFVFFRKEQEKEHFVIRV